MVEFGNSHGGSACAQVRRRHVDQEAARRTPDEGLNFPHKPVQFDAVVERLHAYNLGTAFLLTVPLDPSRARRTDWASHIAV